MSGIFVNQHCKQIGDQSRPLGRVQEYICNTSTLLQSKGAPLILSRNAEHTTYVDVSLRRELLTRGLMTIMSDRNTKSLYMEAPR